MAIGTPKTNGKRNAETIVLQYPGKRTTDEILAHPAGELVRVGKRRKGDNRLIFADNLNALVALAEDEGVAGKVTLVYIDPPFSTQSTFHSRKLAQAYEDTLAGAEFIEFLRAR